MSLLPLNIANESSKAFRFVKVLVLESTFSVMLFKAVFSKTTNALPERTELASAFGKDLADGTADLRSADQFSVITQYLRRRHAEC